MKICCILVLFLLIGFTANADMYQSVTKDGTVLYSNISRSGSKAVTKEKASALRDDAKAVQNKPHAIGAFHRVAEEKAMKHNVDPKLVQAVISAESNWNPNAVSQKGAVGMMQLMPKTARDMGVGNPLNADENIEGGVKYLKYLLNKFRGNLALALAAYNAGPSLVEKVGKVPSIPETVKYVRKVMNEYSGGDQTAWDTSSDSAKIRRVVLQNGTLLITNSYDTAHSYE
jgi:soluble lytic murein transglycosylase-like protein